MTQALDLAVDELLGGHLGELAVTQPPSGGCTALRC